MIRAAASVLPAPLQVPVIDMSEEGLPPTKWYHTPIPLYSKVWVNIFLVALFSLDVCDKVVAVFVNIINLGYFKPNHTSRSSLKVLVVDNIL